MSVHGFGYAPLEGGEASMGEYGGKVLLIVNTASGCGFAPQLKGLEELYQRYRDRGFAVVGFPSNQFRGQEPGGREDIEQGCRVRYGVTFPMAAKADVRGENALPLFRYLVSRQPSGEPGRGLRGRLFGLMMRLADPKGHAGPEVRWNFTKFLVDRGGEVVRRYEPPVRPEDIAKDIERLL